MPTDLPRWMQDPIVGKDESDSTPAWARDPIVSDEPDEETEPTIFTQGDGFAGQLSDEQLDAAAQQSPEKAERVAEVRDLRAKHGAPGEPLIDFNGEKIPASRIVKVAQDNNVSPETIARMGTWQGRVTAKLAQTVPGRAALSAAEGVGSFGPTVIGLGDKALTAVGINDGSLSANLKRQQELRNEYLNFVDQDGDTKALLGERGARIMDGVLQSTAKFATAGAGGVAAVYATIGADAMDSSLNEAKDLGLEGAEAGWYATKKAVVEVGVTALFGKIAKKLGLKSFEEILTPGTRRAAHSLVEKTGAAEKLGKLASTIGGAASEAGEELLIDAVSQGIEQGENGKDFDWDRFVDAGISGVVSTGAAQSVKSLASKINKLASGDTVEQSFKGVKAAESAIEKLTDPTTSADSENQLTEESLRKLTEGVNAKEFKTITGIEKTTKQFRDSFVDTVRTYSGEGDGNADTSSEADAVATEGTETTTETQNPESSQNASQATTEGNTPQEGQPATALEDDTATPELEASLEQDKPQVAPPPEADTESVAVDNTSAEPVTETSESEQVTSAKRELVDADREAFDLHEVPDAERQGWRQALDKAKRDKIPDRAMGIALNVLEKPRALSDVETAGLDVAMVSSKKQLRELYEQAENVEGDSLATLSAEIERREADYDTLTQAVRASGTEAGRALAARRALVNDDYDLVKIRQRAKVASGDKLSPANQRKFNALAKQLEDLQQRYDTLTDTKSRYALEFKMDDVRTTINRDIARLRPKPFARSTYEFLGTGVNTLRSLRASFDLPPIARQGLFMTMSRPSMSVRNAAKVLKAALSAEDSFGLSRALEDRPNAALYKQSGLFIADPRSATPNKREEAYLETWFDQHPELVEKSGILSMTKAGLDVSNRVYTNYLNLMRADSFDALQATLTKRGAATAEEAQKIAFFVNAATGRGDWKRFNTALTESSRVLFAPRYMMSRFQLAVGAPIINAATGEYTPESRRLISEEYARATIGYSAMIGLALAAFPDDLTFGLDPTSPDFLKLRYQDTVFDVGGGLSQAARFLYSVGVGTVNTLSGSDIEGGATVSSITRFARSKLAPGASTAMEVATGQDFNSREIGRGEIAVNSAVPMPFMDLAEAYQAHGAARGAAEYMAALWGVGLQIYEPRNKRNSRAGLRRRNTRNKRKEKI